MNETECQLPPIWVEQVAKMLSFAPGGIQVKIRTKDGNLYKDVIISNCRYIIAVKHYKDLPFRVIDIVSIFQEQDDKDLSIRSRFKEEREDWFFWVRKLELPEEVVKYA